MRLLILLFASVTWALRPTEMMSSTFHRRAVLERVEIMSVLGMVTLSSEPVAARSAAEMELKSVPGESTDLKDMLSGFETKLEKDKRVAEQKKLDDEKPLQEKLKDSLKPNTSPAKERPKPGTVVPRVKKEKPPRSIGDGLYGL